MCADPASQACLWDWLPDTCLSRESFHPKAAGITGYAQAMQTRLAQIGYQGSSSQGRTDMRHQADGEDKWERLSSGLSQSPSAWCSSLSWGSSPRSSGG
ncbi:hypothetical protein GCM10017600_66610 [Streptosporangium carneum]|uniref:Uncharacterized protein n=1 Tax=Streptosporangium carneum TaxID=47481 RepID=A0A9W6I981_9ACTN|nr:hypothetical protein GCM10017600_66610 [Streptosporangium carneum]